MYQEDSTTLPRTMPFTISSWQTTTVFKRYGYGVVVGYIDRYFLTHLEFVNIGIAFGNVNGRRYSGSKDTKN